MVTRVSHVSQVTFARRGHNPVIPRDRVRIGNGRAYDRTVAAVAGITFAQLRFLSPFPRSPGRCAEIGLPGRSAARDGVSSPGSVSSGVIGSARRDWLRRGAAMKPLACWLGRHEWTARLEQGQSYTVCASCGSEPRRRRGNQRETEALSVSDHAEANWAKRTTEGDRR